MLLASIEAICHIRLMLPDAAQFFLKCQGFREISDLLELVNADDYLNFLFLCNNFRQLKHLFRSLVVDIVFQ